MESIAIVGASLAGLRAAETLRREGFTGSLIIVGDEVHRPYDRPPLSKQILSGAWDADRAPLATPEAFDGLAADWRLGVVATGLDLGARSVSLSDGTTVAFDGLVIATGARCRTIAGTDGLAGVFTLRTLDDCLAIRSELTDGPRRVVVVGAGFIGAEVAATARSSATTSPWSRWPRFPSNASSAPRWVRSSPTCTANTASTSAPVSESMPSRAPTASNGSGSATAPSSKPMWWSSASAWSPTPNGSKAAASLSTTVCATRPASPRPAWSPQATWPAGPTLASARSCGSSTGTTPSSRGSHAARRLLASDEEPYTPVPWFWSDQYDRKIQLAGRARPDDEIAIVTGSLEERRFAAIYGRNDKLVAILGFNRPRHVMQYRRLIDEGASWADALAFAEAAAQQS
jgi:3-phenylpropionate/trans-cinnamate dioxygenase ferredoxin reductase component